MTVKKYDDRYVYLLTFFPGEVLSYMDKIGKCSPKGKVFQTFNNICKDHRDKIEVPDPLAVGDLISCKLNNKRKLARLITQYRDIFFPIFRKAGPSFFRVLQRMSF